MMLRIILLFSLCWTLWLPELKARENMEANKVKEEVRVLVVAARDNVKSNYYYDDLIAEATGIPVDSIENQFNTLVAQNMDLSAQSKAFDFVLLIPAQQSWTELTNNLKVVGEGQECTSHLNDITAEQYQRLLQQSGADFLVVLNQHYLKWQETPMRTLFHIMSYSVYDKDKNAIYSGNEFFTSMKLEKLDRVSKLIKKPSQKIAKEVIRAIQQ